jgi:hypothetical protein
MQINSPVLRQQAIEHAARRERLFSAGPVAREVGYEFNDHVREWKLHCILEHLAQQSRRRELMARRRALINKWGRYSRAAGLVPSDEEMMHRQRMQPRVSYIMDVVADHFGVSLQDILSIRRNESIVHARHVAIYLARSTTTHSLPVIGRLFGGRDHTTILHAVRKIHFLAKNDLDFADELELLRAAICEPSHAGA